MFWLASWAGKMSQSYLLRIAFFDPVEEKVDL